MSLLEPKTRVLLRCYSDLQQTASPIAYNNNITGYNKRQQLSSPCLAPGVLPWACGTPLTTASADTWGASPTIQGTQCYP